jgi:hypothetical protein
VRTDTPEQEADPFLAFTSAAVLFAYFHRKFGATGLREVLEEVLPIADQSWLQDQATLLARIRLPSVAAIIREFIPRASATPVRMCRLMSYKEALEPASNHRKGTRS